MPQSTSPSLSFSVISAKSIQTEEDFDPFKARDVSKKTLKGYSLEERDVSSIGDLSPNSIAILYCFSGKDQLFFKGDDDPFDIDRLCDVLKPNCKLLIVLASSSRGVAKGVMRKIGIATVGYDDILYNETVEKFLSTLGEELSRHDLYTSLSKACEVDDEFCPFKLSTLKNHRVNTVDDDSEKPSRKTETTFPQVHQEKVEINTSDSSKGQVFIQGGTIHL